MQPDNQGKSCSGGARPMYINALQHLNSTWGVSFQTAYEMDEMNGFIGSISLLEAASTSNDHVR